MLDDANPDVLGDLEAAVASPHLSQAGLRQAQRLLDRLHTGVRVAVIGPQGVGKSQICDVMLSQRLPEQSGGVNRLFYHDKMGREGEDMSGVAIDHPLLKTVTLTDVATGPSGLKTAAREAIAHADVVLWCTQEFSAEESRIWNDVSDHLKDHSFLVLTKADQFAEPKELARRIEGLQAVAAEEFHGFFPTSTFHAHQALCQSGSISDHLFAASGVAALSQTLSHLALSGRRADLDSALLFLERHGLSTPPAAAERTPKGPAHATYEKALTLLRSRTHDLAPEGVAPADLIPEAILASCGDLAEDLAALAADERCNAPEFTEWRNDLFEASDKVVLMGLEGDMRSAADAATIILQLTRDLETRVVR